MTLTINWSWLYRGACRAFGVTSVVYALFLANAAVHYQIKTYALTLAYDQAVIELMQHAGDDPDPNPPTAEEHL
jgi:hypothetical protein